MFYSVVLFLFILCDLFMNKYMLNSNISFVYSIRYYNIKFFFIMFKNSVLFLCDNRRLLAKDCTFMSDFLKKYI